MTVFFEHNKLGAMKTIIPLQDFLSNTEILLKQIAEKGTAIEIDFKGKKIVITLAEHQSKLNRLKRHEGCLIGEPEDIVHIDWSKEWHDDLS